MYPVHPPNLLLQLIIIMATQSLYISPETVTDEPSEPMPPPPLNGIFYDSEIDLLRVLNDHAEQYDYSLIVRSSKINNDGVKNLIYFGCSRGGKPGPQKPLHNDIIPHPNGLTALFNVWGSSSIENERLLRCGEPFTIILAPIGPHIQSFEAIS